MTGRRLGVGLGLAATLVACGAPGPNPAKYGHSSDALTSCPSGATTPGMDVSHFDGTIDWTQAASSGIQFAYAKATEDTGFQDPQFAANWAGMKSAGVLRGAYHFFHPKDDGKTQADFFLSTVGQLGQPGDLPPMLDWELTDSGVSTSQVIQSATAFLNEIKAKTGLTAVIYTYPVYWDGLGDPGGFQSYPFWIANYPSNPPPNTYTPPSSFCPVLLSPWSSWAFWQWSATGMATGVPDSMVDLDVYNGTLAQLQQFAGGGSTPPPPPMSGGPPSQISGNDAVTLVNWPDQHMELFAKTPAGVEEHSWTTGQGGTWASPAALDSGAECGSAAAFWGGAWNYPVLFSPLSSGMGGHLSWTAASGWGKYLSFGGGQFTHWSTAVGSDGRVEVFALGSDRSIWTNHWDTASSNWAGWMSLGGSFVTGAGAITWGDGTVELFATDGAGTAWHAWSDHTGTASWSSWSQMGTGIASRPVPVRWNDGMAGHAEVFARGTDGHLYHSDFSYQTGWPTSFTVVDSSTQLAGEVSAIMNPGSSGAAQGPEVFARDPSGRVLHLYWNGGAYTAFAPLGSQTSASDPFGWSREDGGAEVFAIDASGKLVHASRGPTQNWSAWSAIGGGFDACPSATPPPESDGGTISRVDGGSPTSDAGLPDAGGSKADGGISWRDAGSNPPDAGSGSETDGGVSPPRPGGCGCSANGGSPATAMWLLLAVAALLPRRRVRP